MPILSSIVHIARIVRSGLRESLKARSDRWPKVRALKIAVTPLCESCGGTKRLQVHHVRPFHLDPTLELDMSNLIVLCMGPLECHERLGHGDDFKAYNPKIRDHAKATLAAATDTALRAQLEQEAKNGRLYADPLA
jgi:5-methylcytosine-specific restriction endonuclease McrA